MGGTTCLPAIDALTPPLQGILDKAGCSTVARFSFNVFTPALTFSKLAQVGVPVL